MAHLTVSPPGGNVDELAPILSQADNEVTHESLVVRVKDRQERRARQEPDRRCRTLSRGGGERPESILPRLHAFSAAKIKRYVKGSALAARPFRCGSRIFLNNARMLTVSYL